MTSPIQTFNIRVTDLPGTEGQYDPFECKYEGKDIKMEDWQRFKLPSPDDMYISYYRQKAGFKVPWHHDNGPKSSFNILLEGKAPVEFKCGKYYYEVALMDVSQLHSVPADDEDRFILKMSSNRPYEEVLDDLQVLHNLDEISYEELVWLISL